MTGRIHRVPVDVATPAPRPASEPEDFTWPKDCPPSAGVAVQYYGGNWHFALRRGAVVLSVAEVASLMSAREALARKRREG